MRINIWINKEEAISGKITEYYNITPQTTAWKDFVQVSISQDEFAKLEDKEFLTLPEINEMSMKPTKDSWIISQYNRNRDEKDWVKSVDEIPYIYERNPDTNTTYRRKFGDKHENREVVSSLSEKDYSGEKGLDDLLADLKDKSGGDFLVWFYKLTKNEQTKLTTYYNNN